MTNYIYLHYNTYRVPSANKFIRKCGEQVAARRVLYDSLAACGRIMAMTVYHSDHGVDQNLLTWALAQVSAPGFFLTTVEIPVEFGDLSNSLHGPASGDAPVAENDVTYVQRSADRPLSRMVARPVRATRLLTVIGIQGESPVVFTAYGGPAAEREPGDPSLSADEKAASAAFWAEHALSSL